MASTYLPLAALLLTTAAVTFLVGVPVAAAAADKYSGRMVITRAPGASRVVISAGGALSKWRRRRRLVEDEVAPEFGGGHYLLGADDLNYKGLDASKQVCLKDKSCAGPGEPYIGRACESTYRCPKKPTAWHARAVHV